MIRIVYLLLALLPLGGCFYSTYDLEKTFVAGRYFPDGVYSLTVDTKTPEIYEVRYAGDGYDVTKRGTGDRAKWKLFDIGDPDHLVLAHYEETKKSFLYAIIGRNPLSGHVVVWGPETPFTSSIKAMIEPYDYVWRVKNAERDTLPFLRSQATRDLLQPFAEYKLIQKFDRPQSSAAPFSERPFCADATNRFALVIGNQNYEGALQALTNPRSDATALTKVLCDNGFTTFRYDDLKISEFDRAIARFRTAASNAETAFVYYSGHGFAMNGKNWLVPVDAGLDCDSLGSNADPASLQRRLVDLSGGLLASLPKSSNQIVVMDACRTDPVRSCFRGGAGPTMIRGLSAPSGSSGRLIVYATQDGKPALDGVAGSANSPLMTAMLQKFGSSPRANWLTSMAEISRDVARLTRGDQVPNLDISLPPDGCLARSCSP